MRKFFCHMVNSRRHEVEAHLVLMCLGAAAFVLLAAYHVVVMHRAFEAASYGQGLGLLLAGGGAAAWGQGLQRQVEQQSDGSDAKLD